MNASITRWTMGTIVALLPLVSLLAPLATAPFFAIVAVAVVVPWLWRQRRSSSAAFRPIKAPLLWLAGGLLIWGGMTLLWHPNPILGAALLPRVVLTMLASFALTILMANAGENVRRTVQGALLLGLALAAVFLFLDTVILNYNLMEIITGHHTTPQNVPKRGLTMAAVLLWPAVLILLRRNAWLGPAAIAATEILFLATDAGAAKMALLTGALVFAFGWLSPRLTASAMGAIIALGILSAPITLPAVIHQTSIAKYVGPSMHHRFVIWTFTSEHIAQKPWTGWGFNSSRIMPGGKEIDPVTTGEYLPLHPHNAPLQWWLEMGLPGALLGIALIGVLLRHAVVLPQGRADKAVALATIASALAVSVVAYGAWQLWWLSALGFVGAVLAASISLPQERADIPVITTA